jgi:putative ABC transport system substrate-binding protein
MANVWHWGNNGTGAEIAPVRILTRSGHRRADIAVMHNEARGKLGFSARVMPMRRREFVTLLGSAAAVVPLTARAQQGTLPVIGFMSSRSPEDSESVLAAFRKGLSEGGLVEGKDVLIEFRWARGDFGRLPALAAELVGDRVAVIVAAGGDPSALAAKAATSTIPIVFAGGDPIKFGLVASLNRPGGNVTGVFFITTDLEAKRLGLLHELFPRAALLGVLLNPKFPSTAQQALELKTTAATIGQPLTFFNASTDAELDSAFAALSQQRVTAILVSVSPFFDTRRAKIIAFAAQQKLPAMYQFREYVLEGGLMSYGPSLGETYREVGNYAAKILNGATPSHLPVMQSLKFELVINMKTAKTLGFEFPATFIARADDVIE